MKKRQAEILSSMYTKGFPSAKSHRAKIPNIRPPRYHILQKVFPGKNWTS